MNFGNVPPDPLHAKERLCNWNLGIKLCTSSVDSYISLRSPFKCLSFERLKNGPSEIGISKWLSESFRSWMDARLPIGLKDIFPVKLLKEIFKTWRSVKFERHEGKEPLRLLWLISSSWRCFNSQRPANYSC